MKGILAVPDTPYIIGYGLEIVATAEMRTLIEQARGDFTIQYFRASERSIMSGIQHLAGRFCAKKAILKALGMELNRQAFWLDIEVQRLPTGEPSVVLHGQYRELANCLGIAKWLVSITHVADYAAASAIALL
ncbi:ACP synthase [Nostoc sp. CENA543]|uniref:holo-ACP synthase n=1 Tax=Nostoc sp. CENA543 TaxID=1869241 RepID=UPI000CA2352E|nr:4'-phosphopantetheinyl transferase superfamily protein [Nostoc sp. CENA543]AUS99571.1 ACP synthase [Nostoc sp. CENA543]